MSMSTTSSLLLLLLCISLHACHARRLTETQEAEKKNDQAANRRARAPAIAKLKPAAFSNNLLGEGNINGESVGKPIVEGDKYGDNATSSKTKEEKGQGSGESPVAISWHTRRKRRGEQQQPGFDLDYLPPKTHPPVHN